MSQYVGLDIPNPTFKFANLIAASAICIGTILYCCLCS